MTTPKKQKYPWQLYLLSAFLVFFAIRDYMSTYAVYGQLRAAGVPHQDVWKFSLYPREASLYLGQHILAGVAFISLLALWSRHRLFPVSFLAYYLSYLLLNGITAAIYRDPNVSAAAVGGVVMHSILCVPWLLYVFMSSRARSAFRKLEAAQQAVQPDRREDAAPG